MKSRLITRREDGRWLDGDRPLVFFWRTVRGSNGLLVVHIATEDAAHHWHCGRLTPATRNLIRANEPPKIHLACRKCNYSCHYGTCYGDISTHESRRP